MEWQSEVGIESRTCRLNRPMIYSYSIVLLQSTGTGVQLHTAEEWRLYHWWITYWKCKVFE